MYRFYLNGTEIQEPAGFEAMKLRKVASTQYGGFISGKFGFEEIMGGFVFTGDAAEIIGAEYKDVRGRVDLVITFCERTVFDGILDMGSIVRKGCTYQAQILDDGKQNLLISKHDIQYAIQPKESITLPKKEYYTGSGLYEIGTNREYVANTVGGMRLNIAVPLNVVDSKASPVAEAEIRQEVVSFEVPQYMVLSGMQDSQMSLPLETAEVATLNRQNIPVIGLIEESLVNHNLNTTKVAVRFFDADGREVKNMDWQAMDNSTIKVYLPYADSPAIDTFTGDIYIERRFSGE